MRNTILFLPFAFLLLLTACPTPDDSGGSGGGVGGAGGAGGAGGTGGTGGAGGGCTPMTCAELSADCGSVDDGCGTALDCGSCTGTGETCGGGGVANQCGGGCTPTTCTDQGYACGPLDDGCGSTLDCGGCTGRETCGGAGTAHQCGASCTAGCPTDYTCDATGTCVGGTKDTLAFDVPSGSVSGRLTHNGVDPVETGSCAVSVAFLRFVNKANGEARNFALRCGDGWNFGPLRLNTGRYVVYASGEISATDMPYSDYVVDGDFEITAADQTGVVFDVKSHTVSGKLTHNGQAPTVYSCSIYAGYLKFENQATGEVETWWFRCGTDWTFSAMPLNDGTYTVTASGEIGRTDMPYSDYVVDPNFTVTGDQTGLVFDVKSFTVEGDLTHNGSSPATRSCTTNLAYLKFENQGTGEVETWRFDCATVWTFGPMPLHPGTYTVTARGEVERTDLPYTEYVVDPNFTVSANRTGLTFDVKTHSVSGKLTHNGQVPQVKSCSTYAGFLKFENQATGSVENVWFQCGTDWTFGPKPLHPGTYSVWASGELLRTDMPYSDYLVDPNFTVSAEQTGLVFDVKSVEVSGSLTHNGATPTELAGCGTYTAQMAFENIATGEREPIYFDCITDWTFGPLPVNPGEYRVWAWGDFWGSDLPSTQFLANPSLTITADTTGLVFDVKSVTVAGSLTHNGGAPTVTTNCSSNAAWLRFTDLSTNDFLSWGFDCATDWSFGPLRLNPGVYRVDAVGDYWGTDIPATDYTVVDALQVP